MTSSWLTAFVFVFDVTFAGSSDIRGFIDIPGKLDNLPLLAKILETSQERVSLTRTGRWRSFEYLLSLVQSQIDWHDMSGHTDWIVFVTESTSDLYADIGHSSHSIYSAVVVTPVGFLNQLGLLQ